MEYPSTQQVVWRSLWSPCISWMPKAALLESAGGLSCPGAVLCCAMLCCAVGGSLAWGRAQCLGLATHVELGWGSE